MKKIEKVVSLKGEVFEVVVLDDGIHIEYKKEGEAEWKEGIWSIFCKNHGIEPDVVAE